LEQLPQRQLILSLDSTYLQVLAPAAPKSAKSSKEALDSKLHGSDQNPLSCFS